jgi:hypothetical protein
MGEALLAAACELPAHTEAARKLAWAGANIIEGRTGALADGVLTLDLAGPEGEVYRRLARRLLAIAATWNLPAGCPCAAMLERVALAFLGWRVIDGGRS